MKCKICNEEMIQKDRWRIGIVGVLLVASMMAAFFVPYFWVLGIFLVMIGCYLIVWATLGKGRWCRTCKKFNL